jgi:hypothetical protein
MTESPNTASRARRDLAPLSLWLGLFSFAFALPPTTILFAAPGFWLTGLNTTMVLSPVLAVVALVTGIPARRGAKGPRRAVDYGDPSRVWPVCDMQGAAWGANHAPRVWAELFYISVLYMDGHVRGVLQHAPGHPEFSYDDAPPRQRGGRRG